MDRSFLHIAARYGREDVVNHLLLKTKAKLTQCDKVSRVCYFNAQNNYYLHADH